VPVRIAAGLACRDDRGRADVMRGEETQVFGALRRRPELARGACSIVHPGTHGKWIRLENGRIQDFRTFPTGELFALLQRSSMAGKVDSPGTGSEEEGFDDGVTLALADPGLLGSLFHARAGQVREDRSGAWARGYVSGLLLGTEAAEQRRASQLPAHAVVIGDPALVDRYVRTLGRFGVAVDTADGDDCVLAGLEMIDADG
jgi:2-dehydro-3-deoxygalactonokinase